MLTEARPDPRAALLAAAEAARVACLASAPAGFPGAVTRAPRTRPKPKAQIALFADTPPAKAEPGVTLIQAALRIPPRPCPELPRARVPLADREVIEINASTFVVRIQLEAASLFCAFVDGERLTDHDQAVAVLTTFSEVTGTSWRGCIVTPPAGRAEIDTWLALQEQRRATLRRSA